MTIRFGSSHFVKCDLVIHGNGLFAHVRVADSTGRLTSFHALKPDDLIRIEIALEQGGSATIRIGKVQWVERGTAAVRVIQMDEVDKRKLDEAAWLCVRGEFALFHWVRKLFRGSETEHVYISFPPLSDQNNIGLPKAA